MSTVKIQSSPAPEAGAQQPLSTDAENGRVRGGDFNQDSMSFCRGAEVNPGPAPSKVNPGQVNGVGEIAPSDSPLLGVAGIGIAIKPTDRRTLEGSYEGDSRAQAADAKLPANPATRSNVGQAGKQ